MTIRKSGSRRTTNNPIPSQDRLRLQKQRRDSVRRSLLESLEPRQMMTAGPLLTGIQPNDGELLFDVRQLGATANGGGIQTIIEGNTLTTSPRELVFRFDSSAQIDPASLDGIRITRAGADGVFESATVTTDFGTSGAAIVEFRSKMTGTAGNGEQIRLTSVSRAGTRLPIFSVDGSGVLQIELNSNPAATTRVQDLLAGIAANSLASERIEALVVSGPTLTPIGGTTGNRTLTLQGANSAQALSELGTNNGTLVRLIAVTPGPEGRGISIALTKRNFGGPANPVVTVQGKSIGVQINSTPGFESTVSDFLNALNANPQSAALVTGVLETGSAATSLASLPTNFPTLVLAGAGDEVLVPGYVGLGDTARDVVFRFNENLPDDTYRIDILGSGASALLDASGTAFNGGEDLGIEFELNLGPQVVAVVPEPVRRSTTGTQLSRAAGTIDVYFNNDTLDLAAAQNVNHYQLIFRADNGSEHAFRPSSVTYNSLTNIATLRFPNALSQFVDPTSPTAEFFQGPFRLAVGSSEGINAAPIRVNVGADAGDTLGTAVDLSATAGNFAGATKSLIVDGSISNSDIDPNFAFPFELPGGFDTAGRRELRPEDPTRLTGATPLDYFRLGGPDSENGIAEVFYNFAPSYSGPDPVTGNDKTYFNVITAEQQQRVREAMSLFSEYLGIQFVESANLGTTIAVGDLFSANGDAVSGQGGVVGAVRPAAIGAVSRFPELGVLDFQDFDASTDDAFGDAFSRGAMLLVGQLIGYGYADDLPQPVSQSSTFVLSPGSDSEPTYPSVADILHGQYLYRPESMDVDLYQFTLDTPGRLTAETFAERSADVSLLDTSLRLYRVLSGGKFEQIAGNDDYFSNDSLLEMDLAAGTYVLGVSASGNASYDPTLTQSGFGGLTEGDYQLRLTVKPELPQGLVDATGVALDGDADGVPGGVFNFWYNPAEPFNPVLRAAELQVVGGELTPATIFVDKLASSSGANGSLAKPFPEIDQAMAVAKPGDVVRIVANGGTDGKLSTAEDNRSYQIGIDSLGRTLADGRNLEVPQGVTVVVDAGAILKFRQASVSVGSTNAAIDRSGGALQVLGTPVIVESNGQFAVDRLRQPIPGSVVFTSYSDATVGSANSPTNLVPRAGDWGGIDFRGDLDFADEERVNLEAQGLFLNQIYGADIRYGGGQVGSNAIAPIEIDILRPTIAYSRITNSASAAIEATPGSFVESNFFAYVPAGEVGSTPQIERVGPDIHNNILTNNSVNGLFVRVQTRAGDSIEKLTTSARFDDIDIVHVLSENLIIEGTPGGPIVESTVPPSLLVRASTTLTGSLTAGTYVYRIAYVDANGNETPASDPTQAVTLGAAGGVQLSQIPAVPQGSNFVSRRLYRASLDANGVAGTFRLAGNLNGSSSTFTDHGALNGPVLVDRPLQLSSRLDGSLVVDAGVILKVDGARIETTFGGQLIAEGSNQLPIVITGLNDDRFGAAGAFKTSSQSQANVLSPGDWSGLYVGYGANASLDHVRLAGAGGISRIEGGFASFNPIEVHQGDLRLANSRLEMNADGMELSTDMRAGAGTNAAGTLFVRGAMPTIVNNTFVDGEGAPITIDVNSLRFTSVTDAGRQTGGLDAVDARGNSGPLVRGNAIDNSGINGMVVRGGQTTTEIVFDDTDIVHVVLDTIEVPNQHVFGGLRLESSPTSSLVVKFESRLGEPAGLAIGGSFLSAVEQFDAIDDRIGGSLQLVGFPDFPVILTTLADDSAGAGFTPFGEPQVDTNNDGIFGANQATVEGFTQLPFGPEINNGLRIDNDVRTGTPGFFQATPDAGGAIGFLFGSGVTVNGVSGIQIDQDYIFAYLNMIDVGADGGAFDLASTTITQPPTLVGDDRVESRGTFAGQNGTVNWTVQTYFLDGVPVLFNSVTFDSTVALGSLRVVNYLDEDIDLPFDDVLFTTGTPGEPDFRAFTIDGQERIGFAQGGYYEPSDKLVNANYIGWAADQFNDLITDITGGGTNYTIAGNIDLAALPQQTDPQLGLIYGPNDVTTAFAWDVDPNAFSATITSFLELIPRDPSAPQSRVESGLWKGVSIREGASDRNVVSTPEYETIDQASPGINGIPGTAQYLGALAAESRGGDENLRLGFTVDGEIATPSDLDVYSFVGRAGTEVWLDIDRTEMSFDSVVELIDANGLVLVSSDSSAAETLDPSQLFISDRIDPTSVGPLTTAASSISSLAAAQDPYSTNPRDAGFRVRLPGEAGTQNLYHVRVRSSNNTAGDIVPDGPNSGLLSAGQTAGSYRLQVRLREADEFPGTQVRFGDIRYGQTNLEVVGQPLHSPLLGEAQETSLANDARTAAQPIGPFSVTASASSPSFANLAASDRLSLSVGGSIDSAADVDWYRFDIAYGGLAAGSASQFLSTIFDLDYADGFARADMSLYVFDEDGRLILTGLDSNVADDQPRPGQGTDSADLSRGSAGTADPFIGSVELLEGTYFVAVTNHSQVPAVLNQYYADPNDPNVPLNPLLRLEPITSIRRVIEDPIDLSAAGPGILFSESSVEPLTLDDLVVYTLNRTGSGVQTSLNMNNPFNGQRYGSVGLIDPEFADFAVRPTGELYGYSIAFTDAGWQYVQISSEDGSLRVVGPTNVETFHEEVDANGARTVADSNNGLQVEAITFADSDLGFLVANRPDPSFGSALGPDYTENIVYQFDAATGQLLSGPLGDRAPFTTPGGVQIDPRARGAGTNVRERGFIDTTFSATASNTINVLAATSVNANGVGTRLISDGDGFSIRDANGTLFRFEFNSGPDMRMEYDADAGIFVRDGDTVSLNGVIYEFETGGSIVVQDGATLVDGATVTVTSGGGVAVTFEMTDDGFVSGGNLPVAFDPTMTAGEVAAALADAINAAGFGVTADALGNSGEIGLVGESSVTPVTVGGVGLAINGGAGLINPGAIAVTLEEGVSFQMFIDGLRSVVQDPVAIGVAGDRVNFRDAVAGNDFSDLRSRGIILTSFTNPTGLLGDGAVSPGSTGISFLASDSTDAIAARIAAAVNSAAIGTITATAAGRSVTFTDAILNRNEVEENGGSSPVRLLGIAPGGSITGIQTMNGRLFAVSSAGGLFVVNNPTATVQGRIGNYVSSATDLLGINFQGLSRGPEIDYVDTWTTPGTAVTRSLADLLFGISSNGRIFAFNTAGQLQPVFANGATSIQTGTFGLRALEMSTLDFNLWHQTDSLPGGNTDDNDSALYFGYRETDEGNYFPANAAGNTYSPADRPVVRPRGDGQPVDGTYNFPGGAAGAIQSDSFSLVGYSAADLPYLYFDYFLGTDGVDGTNNGGAGTTSERFDSDGDADRDALQVYVITPEGRSILVATNNSALGPEDDDDALDRVDGTEVGLLHDNAGWRQARVSLASFAGMSDLKLRIEFSTAGQMSNGTVKLRTVAGQNLQDGQTITINGRDFELDLGPTLSLPAGVLVAEFYSNADGGVPGSSPDTRLTLEIDGVTFVLNDGLRNVAAGEVDVLLAIADDPLTPGDESLSLTQLSGAEVAGLVRDAILANPAVPVTIPGTVDFSREPNDELARAVILPRSTGNTIINGNGRLGTVLSANLNDVDLVRLDVREGETVQIDVVRTSGLVTPKIRVFDQSGRELNASGGTLDNASLSHLATSDGPLFIGINGGGDYNPNIAGSGTSAFGGTYNVTVEVGAPVDVLQVENRLQVTGVVAVESSDTSVLAASGTVGVTPGAVRVPVTIEMTAAEVALALRSALATEFAGGATEAFPVFAEAIELGPLSVSNAGPFAANRGQSGDQFGALGPGRARGNANQGVFLDNFIVGFAERGEIVTGAPIDDTFTGTLAPSLTLPAQPTDPLLTGSYQLEIRDGSETIVSATGDLFRQFDTNDRLTSGAIQITAPLAAEIADGDTFTLSDGLRTLTFEFDLIGSTGGVQSGHLPVPFDATLQGPESSAAVAEEIVKAINSPGVQALLAVSALPSSGVDTALTAATIHLFGAATVGDAAGLLNVTTFSGRGDSNRERAEQGVILIENSRFSYASQFGIDLNHDVFTFDGTNLGVNVVRYPRNLVELNTEGLVPGVVLQSNTIAYSGEGGIRVLGVSDTNAAINPVAFDRIVNNTIVGGTIAPGRTTPADTFQGLFFGGGSSSFADAVVSYDPLVTGGPQPDFIFRDPSRALGAPDALGAGPEPTDGTATVSLGYGGTMTLQFTDNYLTGDGTAAPDLAVFEVGAIESVAVEVSRDGVTFIPVGLVGGLSNRIDIDAYGFTPQDRLAFVRLTDLRQGDRNSLSVGADIDAVGALSSVPADVYLPSGIGIQVSAAAPTLMNNVFANLDTGVDAQAASPATVAGANVFYRNNQAITGGVGLGQFSLQLPNSVNVFVAPTDLVFDPAAGSPLIDSAIDSLLDRNSLANVRGAIGLASSPILAPRMDVNGQLRIDDPTVDAPSGLGENIFKDRGAADRADQAGPVALLVTPRDNDSSGFDQNPANNVVSYVGKPVDAFEIQLVDGLLPSDPGPGVGVADGSVFSTSVLLLRDDQPLIEGVDYQFGYQPSTNTIRLTPLSGVWQEDAVYTIRLLDSNDSVVVASSGDSYTDGQMINLVDETGNLAVLEIETGISLQVPTRSGDPTFADGTTFSIFDGVREVTFEVDTNDVTTPGHVAIQLRTNMTLQDVTATYVAAINSAGLSLVATASDAARIQLTGSNVLSEVDPIDSGIAVEGRIGTAIGYGLAVPTLDGQPDGLVDGQTFAIRRGPFEVVNFEINTGGGLLNPGYVPVTISANATLDGIANALVSAIGGSGLGLAPTNAGFGRVALNGDASYSVELTDTVLQTLGVPGQIASVALPVSIAPTNTAVQVAAQMSQAIETLSLSGVSTSLVGARVIVNGVAGISGAGAIAVVSVRDRVGNLLQSNREDGSTVFTIFLGPGYDYGDAPDPPYATKRSSGGPRHRVVDGFSLGATVTPDGDATANDGDLDDGITLLNTVYSGFDANFQVHVTSDATPYFLDVFVDWDADGVFESYRSFSSAAGQVSDGATISLPVPAFGNGAAAGETYARFRLTRDGIASPLGDAPDGEVEDFKFTINVNPFQNGNLRWDVNASGDVSPIDILQVINALNRAGSSNIVLDPENPVATPPYLDVNGDGVITPLDALTVLNYIERNLLGGGGEGEAQTDLPTGRAYLPAGEGVLGSAATMFGRWDVANLSAEGEAVKEQEFGMQTVGGERPEKVFGSIFESAPVVALDEVIDVLLARQEGHDDAEDRGDEPNAAIDSWFADLGR